MSLEQQFLALFKECEHLSLPLSRDMLATYLTEVIPPRALWRLGKEWDSGKWVARMSKMPIVSGSTVND